MIWFARLDSNPIDENDNEILIKILFLFPLTSFLSLLTDLNSRDLNHLLNNNFALNVKDDFLENIHYACMSLS